MELYRIILPVRDIEIASRFYGDLSGNTGVRVSPGRHYFNMGSIVLACYDPKADGDEPHDWQFHENQYIYFSVPDLADMRRRVIRIGGETVTEIGAMPWGETLFYARDPLGTPICFVDEATVFKG